MNNVFYSFDNETETKIKYTEPDLVPDKRNWEKKNALKSVTL